ncbi:MAG: CHASE2 domain-containing protein [Cyanobacteria bacterium J06639_1]
MTGANTAKDAKAPRTAGREAVSPGTVSPGTVPSGETAPGNVVAIKAIAGSFEQGFPAIVQIGVEGEVYACERRVRLDPAPALLVLYDRWLTAYRNLGLPFRLEAIDGVEPVLNHSRGEACRDAARALHRAFNGWLRCESFRPASDAIWQHCDRSMPLRLLVQTDNPSLHQLPWCAWEVLETYPQADVALSPLNFERVVMATDPSPHRARRGIRVMALVGDPKGIDPRADAEAIARHADIEVVVTSAPTLKQLTDLLWEEEWDVLLFSGHSSSQGEQGWLAMAAHARIEIAELQKALQQSIRRGLQLAILNSCDGLGLARALADLNLPQAIVMRAPVPDRVAHAFLTAFLAAFARNGSLYPAVREARERLQGIEDRYPCASWLPVIVQNPAVRPPTWLDLCGHPVPPVVAPASTQEPSRHSRHRYGGNRWREAGVVLAASAIATVAVMGVRALGALEALELAALDRVMTVQPAEPLDPRVLVVALSETDVRDQPQGGQHQGASLSDESLLLLLQKLDAYQPRAIGLDIYRNYPASQAVPQLAEQLQHSDRLVVACKVSDESLSDPGVAPPPEVSRERWGFTDFLVDRDGVLRRHLLALTPEPTSTCATPYAFSTQLSFRYLAGEGIVPRYSSEGILQVGDRAIEPLWPRRGGYRTADLWGYQTVLRYRTLADGKPAIRRVGLLDVLNDRLNPEFARDRVVLIGTVAPSYGDRWTTPFSTTATGHEKMAGVMVQAQAIGQLLGAALDDRPLIVPLSYGHESLWIFAGAWVGSSAIWLRKPRWMGVGGAFALLFLGGSGAIAMHLWGWWVPVVPAALAGAVGAGCTVWAIARSHPSAPV